MRSQQTTDGCQFSQQYAPRVKGCLLERANTKQRSPSTIVIHSIPSIFDEDELITQPENGSFEVVSSEPQEVLFAPTPKPPLSVAFSENKTIGATRKGSIWMLSSVIFQEGGDNKMEGGDSFVEDDEEESNVPAPTEDQPSHNCQAKTRHLSGKESAPLPTSSTLGCLVVHHPHFRGFGCCWDSGFHFLAPKHSICLSVQDLQLFVNNKRARNENHCAGPVSFEAAKANLGIQLEDIPESVRNKIVKSFFVQGISQRNCLQDAEALSISSKSWFGLIPRVANAQAVLATSFAFPY